MVSRAAAVALYAAAIGFLALCAAAIGFRAIFGGADPDRLDHVSRIRISVDTIVSGKPVSGEWIIPAIRHWDIPEYWLVGGTGTFQTVRSPFDTVFMRLPTGEGMGVDLQRAGFDMTWYWHPVASPRVRERSLYYLLDSVDRPKVLIDYSIAAQAGTDCPKEDLVLDCKVSSSMTLIKAGPLKVPPEVGGSDLFARRDGSKMHEELRRFGLQPPKPMIFVYVRGGLFHSSALRDDPELEPLSRTIVKPTIAWIDWPTRKRLEKSAKQGRYVDLAYDGSNTWSLEKAESRHPGGLGPRTAHLTEVLMPDDLECCQWPETPVKKDRRTLVLAAIMYRGERVSFPPMPASSDKIAMLIDPDNGTVMSLYGPMAKVIWKLPSK